MFENFHQSSWRQRWWKFSQVSWIVILWSEFGIGLTFENFHQFPATCHAPPLQVEFLKSQRATEFAMWNECTPSFWEISSVSSHVPHLVRSKFSKVSALLNILDEMAVEHAFEKFGHRKRAGKKCCWKFSKAKKSSKKHLYNELCCHFI